MELKLKVKSLEGIENTTTTYSTPVQVQTPIGATCSRPSTAQSNIDGGEGSFIYTDCKKKHFINMNRNNTPLKKRTISPFTMAKLIKSKK